MRRHRPRALAGIAILLVLLVRAVAAMADPLAGEASPPPVAGAPAAPSEPARWSLAVATGTYVVPETPVYEQPTVAFDYDWFHAEARYNYEALDTGSVWLGTNLGVGERLRLDVTPMVGGVFGDVNGVAPGLKLTLAWWKLELYSEAEYLFDTEPTGDFGYVWSELALAPVDWMRFGLVSQRTNAYETDVDFQRGLLLGLAYRRLSLTTYVFDLDRSHQPVVLTLGAEF